MFIHVLHLIPDWQEVIAEARRCLKPRGGLVIGYDWRSQDNPIGQVRRRFKAIVAELLPDDIDPEPGSFTFMEEYLLSQGAHKETWEAAHWTRVYQIAQNIDNYASGYYSSAHRLAADVRQEAIRRLREWCLQQFGDLKQEFLIPQKFIWERYRWDA
jgi:ubiquinone/menaquinone biosynthesis C-methylase UbiE